MLQKDHVSRLLSPDGVALLQHTLQHVAVAHGGALQVHTVLFGEQMQPQIGHDGGHHCVSWQLPLPLHVQAACRHDLVAVDQLPPLIHCQAAVCVAVKGDADVIAPSPDHGGQGVHVGGTALFVDVDPVRVGVDDVGAQLGEAVEQAGGGGGGGTIGTVHQDAQAAQGGVDGGLQVVDVVL